MVVFVNVCLYRCSNLFLFMVVSNCWIFVLRFVVLSSLGNVGFRVRMKCLGMIFFVEGVVVGVLVWLSSGLVRLERGLVWVNGVVVNVIVSGVVIYRVLFKSKIFFLLIIVIKGICVCYVIMSLC